MDKLYGKKPGEPAGAPAEGGETPPDMGGGPPDMGDLGGAPPPAGGEELGGAPPAGGAELAPESKLDRDMNLILEEDLINGTDELDLSKGRKSLIEIENKLDELLNK